MEPKYCLNCGKELTQEQLHRGNWKYCSRKCAREAHKEVYHTCTCVVCGKEFQAHRSSALICSEECRSIRKREQSRERARIRGTSTTKSKKTKHKHESQISEEQAAAQAHGMSYGKWKALQYIENMPKINTKV